VLRALDGRHGSPCAAVRDVAGEDDSGEKDYRTYHSQFGNTGASGVMPAGEDGDIKAGVLNDSASAKLHSKALSK